MSRAIRFHQTGGPEVLKLETEVGEPGPGQARVRHTYVAVNFIDVYFRTGHYPLPLPNGLGSDAVGVVEAVGSGVTDIRVGDRVGYLLGPQGAYADVRLMPAEVLIPLPDGIPDRTASTLMMKGMTAQYLFRQVYPLKGGETILYHAAAGGVGLIACQWAKALGVTMIGTVSTDAKAEMARAHGCAHTIVTSRENIAERVREITGGKGVPVVYDSVGKDTLMASLDSLQPRGTLVSNGTSSGPVRDRHNAACGQRLIVGDASRHDPLRNAACTHAGNGQGTFRPGARRQDSQRAEPEFRVSGCCRSASRAGIAEDGRRHRTGALSRLAGRHLAMDLHSIDAHQRGADDYLFGRGQAWFALVMTIGLMAFDYIDRQVIVSLFPYLKTAWGPSDKQLGALVSVVSITVALGAIPVALFADRASRVKSIVVMAVIWSLATISCMFTRSYSQLLAARSVVGMGEAGYGSVGAALIASHFPSRMRGALMAAFFASASVGSVLGVMLGGVIAARWGWHAAFGVVGFPGLALALLYLKVRDYRTVELTPTLDQATRSMSAVARHIVRILTRSRTMLWVCIAGAAQLIVVSAVWSWLPSFLNRVQGIAPAQAGVRAALVVLAGAIGSVVWGAVVDRAGMRRSRTKFTVLALLCLATLVGLVFAFGAPQFGLALSAPAQFALIALGGFLMTCTVGPVSAIVIDVIHPGVRATGCSVLALFQNLFGLALGPFLAGVLSDAWGLESALTAIPAFSALAAIAFLVAGRSYETDKQRANDLPSMPTPTTQTAATAAA